MYFSVSAMHAAADCRTTVIPVDGEPFAAERIVAIDAAGRVTFQAGGQQRTVPAADLVRWGDCLEPAGGGALIPNAGGLLAGDVAAAVADTERLTFDSPSLGMLKIPKTAVSGVLFCLPSDFRRRDVWIDRLQRAGGATDLLFLDNGDQIEGAWDGMTDGGARWRAEIGPIEFKIDRATAVLFRSAAPRKSTSAAAVPDRGLKAWIGLADGSRMLVDRLATDGDFLAITAADSTWRTASKNLVFLQPFGGRVAYLSDLRPTEYRQTPYLELAWPYRTDRNVAGGMLRSGGRLFLKGLGVHGDARLVYDLSKLDVGGLRNSSPRRFEALAGIDDSTDGRGSVVFRVLLDGRERFTSKIVRGGDAPVPVSVELAGSKRLELVVECADWADVSDRADWLDARLVW